MLILEYLTSISLGSYIQLNVMLSVRYLHNSTLLNKGVRNQPQGSVTFTLSFDHLGRRTSQTIPLYMILAQVREVKSSNPGQPGTAPGACCFAFKLSYCKV